MKIAPFVLPLLSKNKDILQGTTVVSLGDFNFFHGQDRWQVRKNIKSLKNLLHCSTAPLVLVQQVHGCRIKTVRTKPKTGLSFFSGFDALITEKRGLMLGILTADCLPVFLFDRRKKAIGLVHAGWRGIAQGIVPATIAKMKRFYHSQPADLVVGIGPHISRRNYEVDASTAEKLGLKAKGKTRVSLAGLVKDQLKQVGVPGRSITETATCTYASKQCYSYRRQAKETGRMLSFLLLK